MIESPLLDRILAHNSRQTKQSDILRYLKLRFGPIPQELAERLRSVEDDSRLEDLLDSSAICSDLEAFRLRLTQS